MYEVAGESRWRTVENLVDKPDFARSAHGLMTVFDFQLAKDADDLRADGVRAAMQLRRDLLIFEIPSADPENYLKFGSTQGA